MHVTAVSLARVQILAHHTDFPEPEEAASDPGEVYRPFLSMLQFALEALLLPTPSVLDPPGQHALILSFGGLS